MTTAILTDCEFYQLLSQCNQPRGIADVLHRRLHACGINAEIRIFWQVASNDDQVNAWQSLHPMDDEVLELDRTSAQNDASLWPEYGLCLIDVFGSSFYLSHAKSPTQVACPNPAIQSALTAATSRLQLLFAQHKINLQQQHLEQANVLQQALYDISNLAYSEDNSTVLYRKLHEIVGRLVYAENFFIVTYNTEMQSVRFLYFADSVDKESVDPEVDWTQDMLPNSISLAMLKSKSYAWGDSVSLIEKFGLIRDFSLGEESCDWLGIPMLENDTVVGGIVIQSYLPDKCYSHADLNLMMFVADHIRQSLTRREQTEQLERMVEERTAKLSQEIIEREHSEQVQRALFNITHLANQSENLDQFYPEMHRIVGELLDAKNIYVAFLSEDQKSLDFPYHVDEKDDAAQSRPLSKGLTEWVLHTGKPTLVNDTQIKQLNTEGKISFFGEVAKCWLGIPLISNGRALGIIALQSYSNTNAYSSNDQELLMFVSAHIAQALQKIEAANHIKKAYAELESNVHIRTNELQLSNQALREQIVRRQEAEEKLKYDALHDQLTGLPNRSQLYSSLHDAIEKYHGKPSRLFAVFFIDLDRFKVINDSMGHWVGDELLKHVAERILRCVRKPDLVARLGGDEFAVVLNSIRNIEESRIVADRMLHVFQEPIHIQGKELFVSPSIGIAISHERHSEPDEILRDADIALYRSKELGRNRFTYFDDALHQSAMNTLLLEGDLRRGITRTEIIPYYQAIYDIQSNKAIGFEALMRWKHPQHGVLAPKDFSEIAKDTGLIEQIDWQMYEQVCRDLPILLRSANYASINVSPRHLGNEQFANRLMALLAEYGVSCQNLIVEVTEDALIEHPELGLRLLTQLKQAGIRIHLDDFGTGYSSFSYLHKYPLDCLKIDRSFISTIDHHAGNKSLHLVKAIHALGVSLGLDVIAEGIETTEQMQILAQIGIGIGQGHLFALPTPIEKISEQFSLSS